MDKQAIFDQVATHLLAQDEKAMEDGGLLCVYLDEGTGLRCAIGALIPNDHPALNYRGSVRGVLTAYPDLKKSGESGMVWRKRKKMFAF